MLLTAAFARPAQAQTPTPRQWLDNHFAQLDKSQVPTGMLAEYGLPLAPLSFHAGTLTDSSLTSPEVWRMAYATVASACIYGATRLPSLPAINTSVDAAEAAGPGTIPLLVARIDNAAVWRDAFTQNLLTLQNGRVYDVVGRHPALPG